MDRVNPPPVGGLKWINVDWNEIIDRRGIHHIKKGPNDEVLPWPFQRRVYLSLINTHSRQKIVKEITPDPRLHYFHRPSDKRNVGYGFPKFVPLMKLQNQESEYIAGGAICMRITITSWTCMDKKARRGRYLILFLSSVLGDFVRTSAFTYSGRIKYNLWGSCQYTVHCKCKNFRWGLIFVGKLPHEN